MLLFGHIGITLGAAYVLISIANRVTVSSSPEDSGPVDSPTLATPSASSYKSTTARGFRLRGRVLDWRLLVLGALLPDIIDKPIGILFFGSEGRLLGHTLIFAIMLGIIGLYLTSRGRPWVLILAICCVGHLILDGMWIEPDILLWPAHGWYMASYDPLDWAAFGDWLHEITHQESQIGLAVLASELIGAAIVALLIRDEVRKRRRRRSEGSRNHSV
jgi:inner membrane protein